MRVLFALAVVLLTGLQEPTSAATTTFDPTQAALVTGFSMPNPPAPDITSPPTETAPPPSATSPQTAMLPPSGCDPSAGAIAGAACWRHTPWNRTVQEIRSRCNNDYRCSGHAHQELENDNNIEYCVEYSTVAQLAWERSIYSEFRHMSDKSKTEWIINTGEILRSSYPMIDNLHIVGAEATMAADGMYGRSKDEVFNFAMNMCLDGKRF